jgi:small nuclear ribonucleoprotein (snRNP)-like protein
MKDAEIKEYIGNEVLLITKDNFRNYGIIEAVDNNVTKMTTPNGQVSIVNEEITLIREKKVVWE